MHEHTSRESRTEDESLSDWISTELLRPGRPDHEHTAFCIAASLIETNRLGMARRVLAAAEAIPTCQARARAYYEISSLRSAGASSGLNALEAATAADQPIDSFLDLHGAIAFLESGNLDSARRCVTRLLGQRQSANADAWRRLASECQRAGLEDLGNALTQRLLAFDEPCAEPLPPTGGAVVDHAGSHPGEGCPPQFDVVQASDARGSTDPSLRSPPATDAVASAEMLEPRMVADLAAHGQAARLVAEGRLAEGGAQLIALAEADTPVWQVYNDLAALAVQQADLDAARELLRVAIAKAGRPTRADYSLALLDASAGRFEDALAGLSPLLRQDSANAEALALVRDILGQSGPLSAIAWARLVGDLRHPTPQMRELLQLTEQARRRAAATEDDRPSRGATFPESALAHWFLDGKRGIEIGASSHNPFGLRNCLFVDKWATDTTYKRKEVDLHGTAQKVDVLSEGDRLPFPDDSLDYIVTSHVLEHFHDTIGTLKEWYRVVRDGGIIFTIFPHKERTFDRDRPRTTLRELLDRHALGGRITSDSHHTVWITDDAVELVRHLDWKLLALMDADDKVGNGFTFVVKVEKRGQ